MLRSEMKGIVDDANQGQNVNIKIIGDTVTLAFYKDNLGKKIKEVCGRIGFDYSKQNWYIYDPEQKKSAIGQVMIGLNGKDYAYTDTTTWDIYISSLAFNRSGISINDKLEKLINKPIGEPNDFLANMLIDEITHVQTHADHGTEEYDKKLEENLSRYYLTPIDRALGKRIVINK